MHDVGTYPIHLKIMIPDVRLVDEAETRGDVRYVHGTLNRFLFYVFVHVTALTWLIVATDNLALVILYPIAVIFCAMVADGYDAWVVRKSRSGDTWYLAYESWRP